MAIISYFNYHLFDLMDVNDFFDKCSVPAFEIEPYGNKENYINDFVSKSNIHNVSIGDANKAYEISKGMVRHFFTETKINPEDIECIIYVDPFGTTAHLGSMAHVIAKDFKFEHANVFILNQACGSSFLCTALADNFIREKDKYLLVLSSCFSPNIDHRLSHTSIIGDAIGILALKKSNEGKIKVIASTTQSDGTNSYNKVNHIDSELDALTIAKTGSKTMKRVLEQEKVKISDLLKIIPQNINTFVYEKLYAGLLKVDKSLFFLKNISNGGHLGDVDLIRNLTDYFGYLKLQETTLDDYETILLYGMGGPEGKDKNYHAILLEYNTQLNKKNE